MKLSYEWIKEYVNIDVSPKTLAEGLTLSGSEVECAEEKDGDTVMSLEITSNRPDCLNMLGLAREVSAVFDAEVKLPELTVQNAPSEDQKSSVKCVIESSDLCPLYTAKIIKNVKITETSKKIKRRLLSIGSRAVNNIVDITNYCLMETGHPLHAFDLDKIAGDTIFIREAVKGEKIVTIDDVERTLKKGMLVIADKDKPIAIAGIMGGKHAEVTEKTKNILLESAYFDPLSVRHTSRDLALTTDSSYRFERGVNKEGVETASLRASGLILEEAGGEIECAIKEGEIRAEKNVVSFDSVKAGDILGVKIDPEEIKRIFSRLGMKVTSEKETLTVEVPAFREDLTREIDLVEEAARIYGYENIPAKLNRFVPQVKRKERSRKTEEKVKDLLVSSGCNEIMTYSLISEAAAEKFKMVSQEKVTLMNSLSEEQKVLTPNLIDGMLKTISWNLNRKNSDLRLFESGKIYVKEKKEFGEYSALCIGATGNAQSNWKDGSRKTGLYDLKGLVETVLDGLSLEADFRPIKIKGLVNCAGISLASGGKKLGFLCEVGRDILDSYDINQEVYVCQVRLDSLAKDAALKNKYKAIDKFPSSERDISVLCDETVSSGRIMDVIKKTGGDMIRSITFKDIYEGEQIPAGKKSLTYSINYGLDTRTITDEDTEKTNSKIKDALTRHLKVSFR